MASLNAPKILSIKISAEENQTVVSFEWGSRNVQKQIPNGHGLVRAHAVFDEKYELVGLELVTEKL